MRADNIEDRLKSICSCATIGLKGARCIPCQGIAEIERLKGIIEEAEHCQWCATNDDAPGDCDCFKAKVEAT